MKSGIILLLATFFVLVFDYQSGNSQSVPDENRQIVLRLVPGPDNPRNSEGSFITLKDGRILFIYSHFTGTSSGDFGHAYLAGRYSYDRGKTWDEKSHPVIGQEGLTNVMSVSLLRLRNGNIALFYLRKNSDTDCIPMMRISNDEAVTWSDPVSCIPDRKGYFVLNNDRVIQLKNKRLVVPVSLHQTPGDSVFNKKGRIFCYYSDDNGQTWKSGEEVPNPHGVLLQEPGIIALKNEKLFMFLRTDKGVQYVSYSGDNGGKWSPVKPGNIVSPCSPASVKRIPDTGHLLLVWNNNGNDQKRTPLNIAVSMNEGKKWKMMKTIEDNPDGWYCYTAVQFTGDHVLLAYCAGSQTGRAHLSTTNIARLSLNRIYQSNTK